jgi:hypothetical protein
MPYLLCFCTSMVLKVAFAGLERDCSVCIDFRV